MLGKLIARMNSRRKANRDSLQLYQYLVTHARSSRFYLPPFNVEDSIEGRFELILIHMFIVDLWLSSSDKHVLLRQALQETLVRDMDRSLREMGIGDMSVGKQMKKVGAALLGRLQSYKAALVDSETQTDSKIGFAAVISRNINGLGKIEAAMPLADYMVCEVVALGGDEAANREPAAFVFSSKAS